MMVDHAAWDLASRGWPVPVASPGWTAFGDIVAATFLLISGIGLALARPRGAGPALRRLATLLGAALCVSAATAWIAPDAPVVFGVLHCILVSNALALAALRLPGAVRLCLAAAAAALPALVRLPAFDAWPQAALGLARMPPPTLDYRPLLPWLALVLVGTVLGEALARRPRPAAPPRRATRPLAWLGRHALAAYLIHQPLLYGAVVLAGVVAGGPAGEEPFVGQCRADCAATGATPKLCSAACACAARRLAAEAGAEAARLTPAHAQRIDDACRAQSR